MNTSIKLDMIEEFINLEPVDISPYITKCDIKVLYEGKNDNMTVFDKATIEKMSKTLRGNPIAGYYKKDKKDFTGHGKEIVLNDEGVDFLSKTQPYGFVPTDAKVWWQAFREYDRNTGEEVTRNYLMTSGYLWTHLLPDDVSIAEGRPQSMEIDIIDGRWTKEFNSEIEFFIVNDAVFSQLCILGEDVEPCFEGASIIPEKQNFSKLSESSFIKNYSKMMFELSDILKQGGEQMENVNNSIEEKVDPVEAAKINAESEANAKSETSTAPEKTNETETPVEDTSLTNEQINDGIKPTVDQQVANQVEREPNDVGSPAQPGEGVGNEQPEISYSKLYTVIDKLADENASLKAENEALKEFRNKVEEGEKDKIIYEQFAMLSDEEKALVIANKANYSIEQIEEKLAVIAVRKKVNFDLEDSVESENNIDKVNSNYSLSIENEPVEDVPGYLQVLRKIKK